MIAVVTIRDTQMRKGLQMVESAPKVYSGTLLILVILLLFSACTSEIDAADAPRAQTTQPAGQPADAKRIEALILQLGADEFERREQAQQALVKIGMLARPALVKVSKETKDPEIRMRAVAADEAIIRDAFQVSAGGVTVRLLGVSDDPKSPTGWWRPDGERIEPPPQTEHLDVAAKGPRWRVFALIAQGLDLEDFGPHEDLHIEFTDSSLRQYEGWQGGDEGRRIFHGRNIARGAKEIGMDVGLEQGPWVLVAEGEPGQTVRDPNHGEFIFGKLKGEVGNLEASIKFRGEDRLKYRVVLVTAEGVHAMDFGWTHSSFWGTETARGHWNEVARDEVTGIRLQARSIQWFRIEPISLERGHFAPTGVRKISPDQVGKPSRRRPRTDPSSSAQSFTRPSGE
jgi:hypothetical protein